MSAYTRIYVYTAAFVLHGSAPSFAAAAADAVTAGVAAAAELLLLLYCSSLCTVSVYASSDDEPTAHCSCCNS
jgi:hypothetical protein